MANPETPKAAEPQPVRRSFGRVAGLLGLGGLVVLGLVGGPRWIDGRAALAWTRYYAGPAGAAEPPLQRARGAAEQAGRAIALLAPLPGAGEAAAQALEVGRTVEPEHPDAARELYASVADSIGSLQGFPFRGLGLRPLELEARRLEARCAEQPD